MTQRDILEPTDRVMHIRSIPKAPNEYEKYQKKQEQHFSSVHHYFLQTLDKLDALADWNDRYNRAMMYCHDKPLRWREGTMDQIWIDMYNAAKNVLNARIISDYVTAGEVSAAVRSKSGKIYVGVCIDTCSTLGICAERNAIFNMITNGEHEIDRVLCIPPNEGKGAPCGACRELMVQLMPGRYKEIEIMIDYSKDRVMKLGELTPEWWID